VGIGVHPLSAGENAVTDPIVNDRRSSDRNDARSSDRRREQRRKQKRYFVDRPGVLTNPQEGIIAMRVLDISLTGLRVSLPCRLKPQTEVHVEFGGAILRGVVRHCECVGALDFVAGIWLPDCDPEKPETIDPHHLRMVQNGLELR
jgi:hypothetical protein